VPKVLLRVNLGVFPVKAKYVVPNSGDYSLKLTLTINKINYYLSIPDPVKPPATPRQNPIALRVWII
tara:strand:+ start:808 stop:1008 length:201 start_codon:yes stop_codon:yes gene_type:complete